MIVIVWLSVSGSATDVSSVDSSLANTPDTDESPDVSYQ